MGKNSSIDFALVITVEGMHFHGHFPEGIKFIPDGDDDLRFLLKPKDSDGDVSGHWNGLTCSIYKSYPATKDQVLFVDSYNKNRALLRVSDDISLPYKNKTKDKILITEDGSYALGFTPGRYFCPSDIVNLIEYVEAELYTNANRFLKLLRWRQQCDATGEVLKHHTLYWSVGDTDGHRIAPPKDGPLWQITVQGMYGIHWSEEKSNDLQKLWIADGEITEPLGHTLLREAATLSSESPRSSILIMTAALETAVKTHISRIAPDTAWLMEEVASPPIFKILRDYIPLIHRNCGKEIDFWEKVKPSIKKIQNLIELRNKVAHTGKIPENSGRIHDFIVLVSDVLYLLDILDGQEWAKSHISPDLRKIIGWPAPQDGRITITATMDY